MGSNWMLFPVFYSGMSSLQEKEILSSCFKKNQILKIKIQKYIVETLTGTLQRLRTALTAEGQTLGTLTPGEPGGASVRPAPSLQGLSFLSPLSPEESPVSLRPSMTTALLLTVWFSVVTIWPGARPGRVCVADSVPLWAGSQGCEPCRAVAGGVGGMGCRPSRCAQALGADLLFLLGSNICAAVMLISIN